MSQISSFRVLSFEPATLALWLCRSLSSHGWCSQYTWQLGVPSLPRRCSRPSPSLHFSASPPSTLSSSMPLGCPKEEWRSNEYRLVDSKECLYSLYPPVPSSALLVLSKSSLLFLRFIPTFTMLITSTFCAVLTLHDVWWHCTFVLAKLSITNNQWISYCTLILLMQDFLELDEHSCSITGYDEGKMCTNNSSENFGTDKEFVRAQVNVTPMILPTQNLVCRTLLRSAERSVELLWIVT